MTFEYPPEIREQQAVVKRELHKLAKMRHDHLVATGQMPSKAEVKAAIAAAKRAFEEDHGQQSEVRAQ